MLLERALLWQDNQGGRFGIRNDCEDGVSLTVADRRGRAVPLSGFSLSPNATLNIATSLRTMQQRIRSFRISRDLAVMIHKKHGEILL